jgi:NADH-quinone oxidoreductase subunit M
MILGIPPLLLVTFFPLVGFAVILFLRDSTPGGRSAIRWTALITSLITFLISLGVLALFRPGDTNLQLVVRAPWLTISGAPISFFMGVDGLSILLLLLNTFLIPIALLSSWSSIQERVKGFNLWFLLLETGMTGVFLAQDLVLFFVFWEFSLIPMYFLIGIWGAGRKVYAALKFLLYTMSGSILMLLAILWLGIQGGTFSLPDLVAAHNLPPYVQTWLFLAFAIAFAVKVPMWPLHSWLPDAHTEAPTAGSVILAGVMLKMGAYGLLRFNLSLFPDATVRLAPWLAVFAVIGIIYGAIVAYPQRDMKRLVAYSSVSHLGFVVLGLFALNPQGLQGSILQMVNHGLSTGALFLIVGMIYERRHTREMDQLGGVWKSMPLYGALALTIVLSSIGLPGLNGFVGEFTILLGSFGSQILASPWFAGIATIGVILAAVYLLHMFEKVFLGPLTRPENRILKDLSAREIITLVPLLVMIFWIGLYPQPFFNLIAPAVEKLSASIQVASLAMH